MPICEAMAAKAEFLRQRADRGLDYPTYRTQRGHIRGSHRIQARGLPSVTSNSIWRSPLLWRYLSIDRVSANRGSHILKQRGVEMPIPPILIVTTFIVRATLARPSFVVRFS